MRVYINMKRNYLSWMTTVLMAFACVAFISCDKDDDKDKDEDEEEEDAAAGQAKDEL